jgi:hypothetical protein
MSRQESNFVLSLPFNATGEMLENMVNTWGNFQENKRDQLGSVDPNKVPRLAQAWVSACDAVLRGYEIAKRTSKEHMVSGAYYDIEMLSVFSHVLSERGYQGQMEDIITKARRAFDALRDPNLLPDVTQEDVQAAEQLVASFDHLYKIRGLRGLDQESKEK